MILHDSENTKRVRVFVSTSDDVFQKWNAFRFSPTLANPHNLAPGALSAFQKMKIGDLCPECGEAAVVNEEGCRKCYACGFSEC